MTYRTYSSYTPLFPVLVFINNLFSLMNRDGHTIFSLCAFAVRALKKVPSSFMISRFPAYLTDHHFGSTKSLSFCFALYGLLRYFVKVYTAIVRSHFRMSCIFQRDSGTYSACAHAICDYERSVCRLVGVFL